MAKRTSIEIEKDYKIIRDYIKNNPEITSLKEVSMATGLSIGQVKTSLEKHPRVFEKIKLMIERNEAHKAEESKIEAERAQSEAKECEAHSTTAKEAVIDASICGHENIISTIVEMIQNGYKIILTNITIRELDSLQHRPGQDGNDARKLLSMATTNFDKFRCIAISEDGHSPDDCIVQFCYENKESITLFTADKSMHLKARAYCIDSVFLTKGNKLPTLRGIRRIGKKLFLTTDTPKWKEIKIYSNGIEIVNCGKCELHIGDNVLIATLRDEGFITFVDFKITSLSLENNCKLNFHQRFYSMGEINILENECYKKFMNDFIERIGGF